MSAYSEEAPSFTIPQVPRSSPSESSRPADPTGASHHHAWQGPSQPSGHPSGISATWCSGGLCSSPQTFHRPDLFEL